MLETFEMGPSKDARAAVIWMHGLGASPRDFEDVVPYLQMPEVRFVFPAAPARPVTINAGYVMPAWYDILHMGRSEDRESEADVRASATAVQALIQRELDRGIAPHKLVLAGFSQGAAMALHLGLRQPVSLAGLMVLSGYLVLGSTLEAEESSASAAMPILFCHGSQDDVVQTAWGKNAHDRVSEGRETEWHTFPMGHSLCLQEVDVIKRWLGERLA